MLLRDVDLYIPQQRTKTPSIVPVLVKMASNQDTKFTSFELDVHGTKITGIHYFPPISAKVLTERPLLVLIHGGTCSAHNFDISPSLTASLTAEYLSCPVVSINRPGYLESSPLPVEEGNTFHHTLGRFNHEHLFPSLWREHGEPQGCKAIVLLAHSLGSPGVFIAAGLHAAESEPSYPLAGFIFSGWGIKHAPTMKPPPTDPAEILPWKEIIMLGASEYNCSPPEAYDAIVPQDQPNNLEELTEIFNGTWQGYWRKYSDAVKVPIMYSVGEHDEFWEGSLSNVKEMESCFPKCPRFDGSVLLGAPHAIEWSYMSQAWYARCFGFACEVTGSFAGKGKTLISR